MFGEIVDGKMMLNEMGKIVESVWESLPEHHPVELNQFQIMPNHVHMIIVIVGATRGSPFIHGGSPNILGSQSKGEARLAPTDKQPTLGTILGLFKSEITKQIRIIMENPQFPVWQRNFYEHIIRDEQELSKIREYIKLNPAMWERDRNNLNL